jgi:hypothetical protein
MRLDCNLLMVPEGFGPTGRLQTTALKDLLSLYHCQEVYINRTKEFCEHCSIECRLESIDVVERITSPPMTSPKSIGYQN